MPSFRTEDLLQQLLNSFEESGANAVLISPLEQRHPRVFVVQSGDKVEQIWVYMWTLTHGGGYRRPHDEFRIQLTGVEPPLQLNPNGPTLLLGYEAARGCFAGFDIRKHLTFTPGSPSIQIRIAVLDDAQRDGIAFGRKGNEEIAVGFRSDYLLPYAVNSEVLHQQAIDPATVALMGKAARQGVVEPQDIQAIVPGAPTRRGRGGALHAGGWLPAQGSRCLCVDLRQSHACSTSGRRGAHSHCRCRGQHRRNSQRRYQPCNFPSRFRFGFNLSG